MLQRRLGSACTWFLAFGCLVLSGSCGDNSKPPTKVAVGCTLNTDCDDPLVCTFARCHQQCKGSRDCPSGERCIKGNANSDVNVCQLPVEASCSAMSPCGAGQSCAEDGQCHDACVDASTCISGQQCSTSGACADPAQIGPGGNLITSGGAGGSGGTSNATGGAGTSSGGNAGGTSANGGTAGSAGANAGGEAGAAGALSGGTAGAPEAGAGAEAGQGGTSAGTGLDTCDQPDPNNSDETHATPYVVNAKLTGCFQTTSDIDMYTFQTPASANAGGIFVLRFTNVARGGIVAPVFTTADDGQVLNCTANSPSGFCWFGAAAGASFRVALSGTSGTALTSYDFQVTFTPVVDVYEPNDSRQMAAPITVGTPVMGSAFAGYQTSSATVSAEDWFKVTLAAGSVTVQVQPSTDDGIAIFLYDSAGVQLASVDPNCCATGSTLMVSHTGVTAGDYYVRLLPRALGAYGTGSTPPPYTTNPYTLTVTQ